MRIRRTYDRHVCHEDEALFKSAYLGERYPDIPSDAYWALGHMGQITMVIPSRDVVVVRLGPSPGEFDAYLNTTVSAILAAFDDSAE